MILLRYKKLKKAFVPLWHCEFLIYHTLFSCHDDKNNKGPSLLCVFTWQWVIIGMTLFITINRRWHISTTPNTTKNFWTLFKLISCLILSPWIAWRRKIGIWIWGKMFSAVLKMGICWVFKPQTSFIFSNFESKLSSRRLSQKTKEQICFFWLEVVM